MSDDDGGHTTSLPGAQVLVSDRRAVPADVERFAALAFDVLTAEGISDAELSLSFVDEDEMTGLHERFMGEAGPTDVLSFPLGEGDRTEDGVRLLGDVVVAPAVATRNNPADPEAELRLVVVHGVLHILGYDHEDDADRAAMWMRQERYSGVRVP
jgi:probable rRNA maturation factor